MAAYALRRLLLWPVVLLILITALFFGLHVGPHSPSALIGVGVEEERRLSIGGDITFRTELAGDYREWLPRLLRGDLGHSAFYDRPVTAVLRERAAPTLLLTGLSLTATMLLGLPIGLAAVRRRGSSFDLCVRWLAAICSSIPAFVLALMLAYALAIRADWLEPSGYEQPARGSYEWMRSLVLPCLTLSIPATARLVQIVRSGVLEAVTSAHARTARGKGVSEGSILLRHGLRSAGSPILSSLGLLFANLAAAVVVVEQSFEVPGLGKLLIQSVNRRDFPVLQGTILVTGVVMLVVYLLFDLLAAALDPRVRES